MSKRNTQKSMAPKSIAQKSMEEIKEDQESNKQRWHDTLKFSEKYVYRKALKISGDKDFPVIKDLPRSEKLTKRPQTLKKVLVLRNDFFTVAQALHNAGFAPLCLISGNDNHPLDGVKRGLDGLEYEIMRRSNYHLTLGEELYPLREKEMLFVPEFTIFYDERASKMKNLLPLSAVVIPSLKRPSLITVPSSGSYVEDYSNPREEEIMRERIANIFKMARFYGYKSLLLTDFGCQGEQNPLHRVISFFNEALEKYPVKYVFFSISEKNFSQFHHKIQRSNAKN